MRSQPKSDPTMERLAGSLARVNFVHLRLSDGVVWLWELVPSPSLRDGFPHGPRGVPALSPQDQLASVVSMLKLPAPAFRNPSRRKFTRACLLSLSRRVRERPYYRY